MTPKSRARNAFNLGKFRMEGPEKNKRDLEVTKKKALQAGPSLIEFT
tara:strand:+ start:1232 stop:1372 length:141 start_codon:yes stop_codon:yes gene_type:complete